MKIYFIFCRSGGYRCACMGSYEITAAAQIQKCSFTVKGNFSLPDNHMSHMERMNVCAFASE